MCHNGICLSGDKGENAVEKKEQLEVQNLEEEILYRRLHFKLAVLKAAFTVVSVLAGVIALFSRLHK
ncbi:MULTISPECIES: hypothetical protein [unclassified Saccharibacter]|uniref:hypothetical protein n=1 Tax=unclassified Saccharibacter TaxID=2648722 RepID=UPI001353003A|nr:MULTISPECIES: hypothetical protein [unclassified Saccharibacter]MXV58387.1 hypothetical protein [Saccharibacter sp. EH70]MXV65895.1 hypothetical protein [Saccharibacter sp. EH60]MXV65938.1 hypothetical protein [Saccharibacter sp. EH60]